MTAGTHDEAVPFEAADGRTGNVLHVVRAGAPGAPSAPARGPVLLVHGAGVRANIFRAAVPVTVVDALLDDGFDVWLENWRASIDLQPSQWTLDEAAVFDHPAAVRTVLEHTGRDSLKAVVHCQGSTSFMMAAVAGLLPEVTTIVSNAVSLHPVIPPLAKLKIDWFHRPVRALTRYLDPHWGVEAPDIIAAALAGWVRLTHRECANTVCRLSSFTYGVGHPTLWSHALLNEATHEWLTNEFGPVPLSFFYQMSRCVDAGYLVPAKRFPQLPDRFGVGSPRTDAAITLLAGQENRCYLPESQQRTFDYLAAHGGGQYDLHVVPRYGHLDMFMGKDASRDVFPLILDALRPN
jgi:alpha/beta hydrolase family protein